MSNDKPIVYFVGDPLEVVGIISINEGFVPKNVVLCKYKNYKDDGLFERVLNLLKKIGGSPSEVIEVELLSNHISLTDIRKRILNNKKIKRLDETYFNGRLFSGDFAICANIFSPIVDYSFPTKVSFFRMSHSPAEDLEFMLQSHQKRFFGIVRGVRNACRSLMGYKRHRLNFERFYTWIKYADGQMGLSTVEFLKLNVVPEPKVCIDTVIVYASEASHCSLEPDAVADTYLRFLEDALSYCSNSESIAVKLHPSVYDKLRPEKYRLLKCLLRDRASGRGFRNFMFFDEVMGPDALSIPFELQMGVVKPHKVIGPYSSALLISAFVPEVDVISDSTYFPSSALRESLEVPFLRGSGLRVATRTPNADFVAIDARES